MGDGHLSCLVWASLCSTITASVVEMAIETNKSIAILYFQDELGDEKIWDVDDLFKKWRDFEQKVPILAL